MDPNTTTTTTPDGAEPALRAASEAAMRAPSIFNTQPWRWVVRADGLDLHTDRDRQLAVTDPGGRMLTISCGIALHHALVALAAAGYATTVERFPAGADLLARITLSGQVTPAEADERLFQAIAARHTDRRPFADTPPPAGTVDTLRRLAESQRVHLGEFSGDELLRFQVTAGRAAEINENDPAYRSEIDGWTHRPADAGDGIPATTTVEPGPRHVPLRGFLPAGENALPAGPGHDGGTRYLVLWSEDDEPADWLAAGAAMSAILLETTASGLAASPMSDVIEIPASRMLMRDLLSGLGHAQIVLRVGVPAVDGTPAASPRRRPGDVVTAAGTSPS